jgi:hypothetical protein
MTYIRVSTSPADWPGAGRSEVINETHDRARRQAYWHRERSWNAIDGWL